MLYVCWQKQRNICDYLWRKHVIIVQYTFYNHCAVITTVVIH